MDKYSRAPQLHFWIPRMIDEGEESIHVMRFDIGREQMARRLRTIRNSTIDSLSLHEEMNENDAPVDDMNFASLYRIR